VRNEDERAQALRDMGAEVVVGNLLDLDSMHRVIAGCETMYFGMSISANYLAATVNTAVVAKHHGVKAFINMSLTIDHPALAKPICKTWLVTAFDAESPQPALWTFDPPRIGSRTPLVLHFDKSISSTAENLIAIRGSNGQRISGDAHLENGETVWRFSPARPWRAGSYAVVTHPDLEDAAGNRPCSPLEVRVTKEVRFESGAVLPFELAK
jgi:hypothetical protein